MISNEYLKKKILVELLHLEDKNYTKKKKTDVCTLKSGKTPKSDEINDNGEIPYYKVSDMNVLGNEVYMSVDSLFVTKGNYQLFPKDSIIFPKNGGALLTNKKRILTKDSLVDLNTGVLIPNNLICYKYLYYIMLSIDFNNYYKGTALPTLDSNKFLDVDIYVPNKESQQNIVNRIDTLFELIDKKDNNDKEKSKLKEILKNKILDNAFKGILLENDLSLSSVDNEEFSGNGLFDVPFNWKWCEYKSIGESNIGLTYRPENVSDDGIIVLRSSNIQNGKLDLKDIVRVNCKVNDNIIVKENDILICARNGSKRLVGKSCLLVNMKEEMTYGAFMTIFRTPYFKYVYWFMQSKYYYNQLYENTNTMTINQVTQKKLNSLIIPLPPFEEQKRIVEKIESLFELIEQL